MAQVAKVQPPLDNPLDGRGHEFLVVGQVGAFLHGGEVEDDVTLSDLLGGLFDVLVQVGEFGELDEEESSVALADEVGHLCS